MDNDKTYSSVNLRERAKAFAFGCYPAFSVSPWHRAADCPPPTNEHVLVLIEGEVHEGYLDSVVLMGDTEPTIFETVCDNRNYFGAQHSTWGHDPYWMPIPKKPKQNRQPGPTEAEVSTGSFIVSRTEISANRWLRQKPGAMLGDRIATCSKCGDEAEFREFFSYDSNVPKGWRMVVCLGGPRTPVCPKHTR